MEGIDAGSIEKVDKGIVGLSEERSLELDSCMLVC